MMVDVLYKGIMFFDDFIKFALKQGEIIHVARHEIYYRDFTLHYKLIPNKRFPYGETMRLFE